MWKKHGLSTLSYVETSEGFKEAAEKFRVESGVQPNIELDGLDDRIKIRDAVQNGRVEDAISLVNTLHPELLDQDRYLYFHLQVCQCSPVEMHRRRMTLNAHKEKFKEHCVHS